MSTQPQSFKDAALNLGRRAKAAARQLAQVPTADKNRALSLIADQIEKQRSFLIAENRKDLESAKNAGASRALLDRIALDAARVKAMANGLREIILLPDPVREVVKMWRRPNGLQVGRMRIPLGVIGIIYEARPNVTADAAALCLKSGNAVILRGGSEAHCSNQAIGAVLRQACADTAVPQDAVQIVEVKDRAFVSELLQLESYIDLIIPRGGEDLIRAVVANSRIPVIKHYKGVCHVYVDEDASLETAKRICFNAKVQPMIAQFQAAGVEIRGCEKTCAMVPGIKRAAENDWTEEYLDLILAIRVVEDMEQAIQHIELYGSEHTESIVTTNYQRSREFIDRVNSSAVMVNASTRFNDGGELGLGAEIGISTSKIHAFGPMGLEELTTTKFIVFGDGQIRE